MVRRKEEFNMQILGWIVFGAIVGWLASRIMGKDGSGCMVNIALGLVGALAGGFIFRPHGIVHSFWNASDVPLRFMDCFFNQNFEDYLEELFHSIIPDMLKANLTPFSPEIAKRIEALDEEFGVTWFHSERQAIIDKYGLNG